MNNKDKEHAVMRKFLNLGDTMLRIN